MKGVPKKTGWVLKVRSVQKRRHTARDGAVAVRAPIPIVVTPSEGHASVRLLRFAAVRERTGLSRSTVWRLEQAGLFPRHRRISSAAVAWVEDEVMGWIRSKVEDRESA